ncbi:hypothetical protein [Embleya sp. AB8]|uniref:hypothetical protein n=1 Tax=Embleya sp. AB8 TaxID=3156304 RepID=UPI003C78EFBA
MQLPRPFAGRGLYSPRVRLSHRPPPLPYGCRMELADNDAYIPEIASHRLRQLPHGGRQSVAIPVKVTRTARFVGPDYSMAGSGPRLGHTGSLTACRIPRR